MYSGQFLQEKADLSIANNKDNDIVIDIDGSTQLLKPSASPFLAISATAQLPETFGVVARIKRLSFNVFDIFNFCLLLLQARFAWLWWNTTSSVLWMYISWRVAYNMGLGAILHYQSAGNVMHNWCEWLKYSHSRLYSLVIAQAQRKVHGDVSNTPDVFKSWLIFREIVDIILVNDIITFIFAAVVFCNTNFASLEQSDLIFVMIGTIFVVIGLVAKQDALRVVKDYAWYWGDFFFVKHENLTFDGIFEWVPHPMYSIGYLPHYGISLITQSKIIFALTIGTHLLQFAFLMLVESPHIKKIYGTK